MNESIKGRISATTQLIIKVAAVVGGITVIAGGYSFYLNNFWKPTIEIVSVDFKKGFAEFKYRGEIYTLDGDATYLLGGDWGLRFGTINKDGVMQYDRIELLKKFMVVEYLKK